MRRAQLQGLAEDDLSGLVLAWTARFPYLAELDSYLWAAMPFWEARLQVSLIRAGLSAEARTDNAARLPNSLVARKPPDKWGITDNK